MAVYFVLQQEIERLTVIDLKNATLFAGFGAIGILWGHLTQIFSRIYSFIIVSVELQGDADDAVLAYMWRNMKCSRFGSRKFTALDEVVRPKDRMEIVAFEMVGKAVTFFKGWRPIFVSYIANKDGEARGGATISFIRGTFDIEKLISDSIEQMNEHNHSNAYSKRYRIKRCFGANVSNTTNVSSKLEASEPKSSDHYTRLDMRPVRWKREDLGAPIPIMPFKNLSYDEKVLEFKSEIERWKNSEKWFKSKGLSWRFAGGIFGPPGTGKTSFIRAIGQELDMPIHIYDLTTMDNEELCQFWSESLSVAPCIVLFEDLDRIFDENKNIKTTKKKSITLDCLLNCIGGVEQANGLLLFITANDPSKLDPALGVPDATGRSTRPGRLDRFVYFGPLSLKNRIEIAERILSDYPELISKAIKESGIGETGAQFESRCSEMALKEYWGNKEVDNLITEFTATTTDILRGDDA